MPVSRIRRRALGAAVLAVLLSVGIGVPAATADPGHALPTAETGAAGLPGGGPEAGGTPRLGLPAGPPSLSVSSPQLLVATHGVLPNDPRRQNVDGIYDAWRVTHGSSNVKVAVIDTGVKTTHPDLVGKVVGQYNAVTGSHSAPDVDGQGTAVASIIGASTDNGVGMSGLAWDTSLLDVRVSDSQGNISDASMVRGIDWAVKQGASVINISLYQADSDSALKAAIARAVAKDVVVVATAGEVTSGWKTYPAAYPGVLAVSAYTDDGKGPSGSWIDVSAAAKATAAVAANDGYGTVSGSAYATPQISALAALIRAAHPEDDAAAVAYAITHTATGYRNRYHPVPLVDGFAAVARNLSTPGPAVVSPSEGTVVSGFATYIDVHLDNFVAKDSVLYGIVGQPLTQYGLDYPWQADLSLYLPIRGFHGPQTVQIYRCMGPFCSTAQPTLVTIDVEDVAPSVTFDNSTLAAGDVSPVADVGLGLGYFVNGSRVRAVNGVIPVDRLPMGDVQVSAAACDESLNVCQGEQSPPTTIHVSRLENPTLSLSNSDGSKYPDAQHKSTRLTFTVPGSTPVDTRLFLGVDPTGVVEAEAEPTVDLGVLSPGTHTYDWDGVPATALKSRSWPVVVETVSPEGLVGRARATFFYAVLKPKLTHDQTSIKVYPVHDGYLDASVISGSSSVPGSVDVVISRGGQTVLSKKVTVGASKAFSLSWNGRTASGAVLSAGAYRVSLTAHDAHGGQSLTYVLPATVSHQRLVSRSSSVSLSALTSSVPVGAYYKDAADHCSKVAVTGKALSYRPCPHRYVETLHQVKLPAAVRYTSVRVSVTGSGTHSHDAYLAYDVPGFLVRWVEVPRSAGRHSGAAVSPDAGWLWPGGALRWVMYDQNGDRYLAKSFSVSIHYQVLA